MPPLPKGRWPSRLACEVGGIKQLDIFAALPGFVSPSHGACVRRAMPAPFRQGGLSIRSPGRIQRGAAAPLCVVSNREGQGRARRVKQTCRGHVCSQSGEQTCLRPGQEKSKSSPPKCRFSCNFSLDKQREVESAACAFKWPGSKRIDLSPKETDSHASVRT